MRTFETRRRSILCLLLLVLLASGTQPGHAAKSGGTSGGSSGGKSSSSSSTSSSSSSSKSSVSSGGSSASVAKVTGSSSGKYSASGSSSRTYAVYGKSYGTAAGTAARLSGVTILVAYVFFSGALYPGVRFDYQRGTYSDDCALRNITAAQQGLSDASIDLATVNALPQLMPTAATSADILTFNQTLYNVTNGLIVDPAYCNYTIPVPQIGSGSGAAGSGLRWSPVCLAIMALSIVAAAAREGGWGLGL